MAELISPNYGALDDARPIFDWMQIIRKRGVVYVGLNALSDPEVAASVGNSMFADLVSVADGDRKPLSEPAVANRTAPHDQHVLSTNAFTFFEDLFARAGHIALTRVKFPRKFGSLVSVNLDDYLHPITAHQ